MARFPRILTALVAALAAVMLVAACGGGDGGDGGGGTDNTTGLTPAQIIERSVAATGEAESFRLAFEVTGTAQLGPSAGALLGDGIDISGEGPVRPPDAASMDVKVRVSGLPVQANITRVGDDVVLGALGTNLALQVDPRVLSFLDFGAAYPELAGWITDPSETGRESVDGTATVRIEGRLDPRRAATALAPLLGDARVPADAVTGTATLDIGTEDLLLRRAVVHLEGDAAGALDGAGAIDLDITAALSEFDEAGDITLPRASRTISPDQLGSLIGG